MGHLRSLTAKVRQNRVLLGTYTACTPYEDRNHSMPYIAPYSRMLGRKPVYYAVSWLVNYQKRATVYGLNTTQSTFGRAHRPHVIT